jgi:hypothetical protein
MKNRGLLILISVVILIGLAVAVWYFFMQPDTPAPATPEIEEVIFPTSADEINWDDREIFKSSLTKSAYGALEELPQASTYYISLEIPEDLVSPINGHQIVRYFNSEDVPLDEIYFRLFVNAQGGSMSVSNLLVDGEVATASYETMSTSLRVDLEKPLISGDSLVFELDFKVELPDDMGGNYGLLGFYENVLVLNAFYPVIPAYDESGWYKDYPMENGDLAYYDAAFHVVQVTAPDDLVLAASGTMVDQEIQDGIQTSLFAIGPSREFYLAGSREFVEINQQVGDVLVRVLTKPKFEFNQTYALDFGVHSIEILNDRLGPYPYREFEIFSAPMLALGMEYPGITHIVEDEFVGGGQMYGLPTEVYLETTLAHETVHMWIYNVVGSDQQNEPWVDEALTQYLTYIYYEDRYGDGSGYAESWMSRWSRVEFADIPIGLQANSYFGQEYGAIVYGRGPLFFLELEEQYGQEMVMDAIQNYYSDNIWGIGTGEEILAALEASCDCDLSAQIEEWVY